MSDDSKKIKFTPVWTKEEQDHITKWKKKTWKTNDCEVCGEDLWVGHGTPVTMVMFDREKDRHRSDKVSLSVSFSCNNCGNTRIFSTETIGLGTKHNPGSFDLERAKKEPKG